MSKEINKILIDKRYSEPIAVQQIIKGVRKEVYNEATGKTNLVGDGEIVWDIKDRRPHGHFIVGYQKKSKEPDIYTGLKLISKGTSKVGYEIIGSLDIDIEISRDEKIWESWSGEDIDLNAGDVLCIRNNKDTLSINPSNYFHFKFAYRNEEIEAVGNCNSLINYKDASPYCFYSLFSYGYGLVKAPDLPSLIAPDGCYNKMFYLCQQLIQVPDLAATSLGIQCYAQMFSDCYSLIEAPILYATTDLGRACYSQMFQFCNNLKSIKIYYGGAINTVRFRAWVDGVSPTGVFYYNGSTTTRGSSAIPEGWTVETF